jgi:hypothetical protein
MDQKANMLTTPQLERAEDLTSHKRATLDSLIREQVIHRLGQPADLLTVQVRPLWGTRYRVNVFVGPSVACATVVDSFFLVTDADGNILEATPKIKRRY